MIYFREVIWFILEKLNDNILEKLSDLFWIFLPRIWALMEMLKALLALSTESIWEWPLWKVWMNFTPENSIFRALAELEFNISAQPGLAWSTQGRTEPGSRISQFLLNSHKFRIPVLGQPRAITSSAGTLGHCLESGAARFFSFFSQSEPENVSFVLPATPVRTLLSD